MEKLIIDGSCELNGTIAVSAAKNAYLPILAATLLSDKPVHFKNLPNLRDIRTILKLLKNLGVEVSEKNHITTVWAKEITSVEATYDLVKTMRASICVLGPLLSRMKKAKVSLPGGCAIGSRPIDLHLTNLEKMGASVLIEHGYVSAETSGLSGAHLELAFPSVGATENLLMAAVFADGETTIGNAALEPEVDDLINFLNAMGAKIKGIGTKVLRVIGVSTNGLKEIEYEVIGDRIEAGTYIMAALMSNSEVTVTGFNPSHLTFVLDKLVDAGANLEITNDSVKILKSELKGVNIDTAPYPGFPTDLQAQYMALMTLAKGSTIITENIFENRFMHVPELKRMGANIILKGSSATIVGQEKLTGAPVMCTDLRASAALVIAAISAKGQSVVQRVYHLDRGYDNIDKKLKEIGLGIKREG